VCGCAPFIKKEVQNAGRAFFETYEQKVGAAAKDGGSSDGETEDLRSGAGSPSTAKGKKKKEKKDQEDALKLSDVLKGEDLYALLELDAGASQDDLRKAYRKMCLVMHPDKQGADTNMSAEEKEEMNVRFVKLQEAFEVLNDPKKRRKYDSMGDFDDSVPSGLAEGEDFFDVFDPVFKRNAKWSERKPVPDLGGPQTPLQQVNKFYDWWRDFESWRDLDEKIREAYGEDPFQDLEEAECREERRWMERENAKIRSKFVKAERSRILKLVENAEKCDPRIRAEKDRQRQAREAEKAAKERQRAEVERLKREEQERLEAIERAAEEARKAEKAEREKEKQAKKAARSALRKRIEAIDGLNLVSEQLQDFLLQLSPEETKGLSEKLQAVPDGDTVIEAMKGKGIEAVILKEDERSTAEGTPSDCESEPEARPARPPPKPRELTAEEKAELEREAAKRAAEKAAREAKKKADQEAAERERRKAEKREAERAKKEEEKRLKDETKAIEKARLEKEANLRRAEESREKARLEKEEAERQKNAETLQVAFERDRLVRADAMDRLEWPALLEAAQEAAASQGAALAAAAAEDPEELLDLKLACLGSFFVLGMRVNPESPPLTSTLRNRVKKLREKLRKAIDKGELKIEVPDGAVADEEALQTALRRASGVHPEPEEKKPAESEEQKVQSPANAKGKKAKAAKPQDEDLDALLAEFGAETTGKKAKKKGKK
jgi:DnaJ family protein C protein 2